MGLGLVLALLWVLGGAVLSPARAAPFAPDAPERAGTKDAGGTQRPDRPYQVHAGDVLTVCPAVAGTCPYTNVQSAVDAASDGDVIKVAAGVYTGVQSRPVPPGYPEPPASGLVAQVVYISKSVTIEGGYTTTKVQPTCPSPRP